MDEETTYAVRQMLTKLVQGMLISEGLPDQYRQELAEMAAHYGVLPEPEPYLNPIEPLFVIQRVSGEGESE